MNYKYFVAFTFGVLTLGITSNLLQSIGAGFATYCLLCLAEQAIADFKKWLAEKQKPTFIKCAVDDEVGKFKKYELPKNLRSKYKQTFGNEPAIMESDYVNFISNNMNHFESIKYFADYHKAAMAGFEAGTVKAKDYHAVNNQEFFISFYDEKGQLVVLKEYEGRKFTEADIRDWMVFQGKGRMLGRRYTKFDFEAWINNLNTGSTEPNEKETAAILKIKDGEIVGGYAAEAMIKYLNEKGDN